MNNQMNNPMNSQMGMMDFQLGPNNNPAAQGANVNIPQMPQLTLQTPQTPVQATTSTTLNNPSKELNVLTLCRIGQETVQDILSRFQDVFSILKNHTPPNGTTGCAIIAADKRQKMQDQFRTIRLLFKRLRLLYDKCESSDELMQIETLIPIVGDENGRFPGYERKFENQEENEEYQKALAENRELAEILKEKNVQLKEIIDRIRNIISEINTMLNARRY